MSAEGTRKGQPVRPLFGWRSAICDSDLAPTTRHVALTLSLHMNERGGSCFPGVTTLAAETGYSRQTVITHLDTLEEHGWITNVQPGGGRGRVSGWEARMPKTVKEVDPFPECPSDGNGQATPPKQSTSRVETVNLAEFFKEEDVPRGRGGRGRASARNHERPNDGLARLEPSGIEWEDYTDEHGNQLVRKVGT